PFTGDLLGEFRRHLAKNLGDVHAGFLENAAVCQDAGAPASAAGARPGVFAKARFGVDFFETGANAVLQLPKIVGGQGMLLVGIHGDFSRAVLIGAQPPVYCFTSSRSRSLNGSCSAASWSGSTISSKASMPEISVLSMMTSSGGRTVPRVEAIKVMGNSPKPGRR